MARPIHERITDFLQRTVDERAGEEHETPTWLLGMEITVDGMRFEVSSVRHDGEGNVRYDVQPKHGFQITVTDPGGKDAPLQKSRHFGGMV